jgi:hypothetical protein
LALKFSWMPSLLLKIGLLVLVSEIPWSYIPFCLDLFVITILNIRTDQPIRLGPRKSTEIGT